jgi:hypothetical protein
MTKPIRALRFVAFCERVLGLRLTRGQRVLCTVAFDGVNPRDLDGVDREIARQLFGDIEEIPAYVRRVLCLLLGRGSGKSTLGAAYGVWRMVVADLAQCGPGALPHAIVVAPTKKTAGIAVRMALALVQGSPSLRVWLECETADGFNLRRSDGRTVAFAAFAASRGGASARGLPVVVLIIEEGQFFTSDSEFVITDRDVFSAIIPRLLRDGSAVFISTPWPVPTLMGELREKNFGAPSTALAARAPTLLMRDGDEAIAALVEAERDRDPENAAREFDCDDSLTAGSSTFFDPSAIRMCVDADLLLPQPPTDGVSVCFGADLAFARDSSTLVGCTEGPEISVVAIEELRPSKGNPLRPRAVIDSFAATILRYGSSGFLGDIHYKESAKEHLEPHNLEFRDAPSGRDGKAETYLQTKKLLHEARVRLPNHARLIDQLRAIVSKPAPGGGMTIIAPRRTGLGHGDLVSGLVLALWAAKQGEAPGWVRAMRTIEKRGGRIFPTDSGTADEIQETRDLFGETVSLEIAGVPGRAVFEYGDHQARFSIAVANDEAFKARIRSWWRSRYGDGPAFRKVW